MANGDCIPGNLENEEDGVLELFQAAALLLGSQQAAVAAIETAVARVSADPCATPVQARREGRDLLIQLSLQRAVAQDPAGFAQDTAPEPESCFDTEELESAGVTSDQLAAMMVGPDRMQLREWLEHLQPASRVVFVLRAMLGKDNAAVAEALQAANGGIGWTAQRVGSVFRGALCSLTGSLVHAPALT